MPVELNALETARFGIVAARLAEAEAPLDAINAAARALGVRLLTARLDGTCIRRVQELEADGFRLMDTLVWYARRLADAPALPEEAGPPRIRLAVPEDAAAAGAVARAAFSGYLGHYHADPRLDPAAADAAYVDWAQTSVRRVSAAAPAFVAEVADRIVGFLTLDLGRGEIVLNAVHPAAQGQGVYGRLVDAAIAHARAAGLAALAVSTQLANLAPQRAWVRRGFVPERSAYTLHKWY